MNTLLVLCLIAALLVCAALLFLSRPEDDRSGPASTPPGPPRLLLSTPEQILYHRLVAALPAHMILAQVQVSRVLGQLRGADFDEREHRVARMSYDFVVCTLDSTVLAAIELDDRSHEAADRIDADARKDRATAAADLRLIRWHVRALPDTEAIQAEFADSLARVCGQRDGARR
ncbi:uncharacterized protein DUF2726 [Sphaerotilus hippei]|uniref:Uncharacterized protein DUF2726 n=1 Tax=Sphaerotilus hippei TaxID=744406 RepID=A0A318GX90_9BURK|nr:DUF2726 domain-containing protein [Sphaerotilus hippei]PXW94304.1 uncharacterized protein DUF2726 [Sphaerotilus hippei]